jgi:hypothetical protein
MKKGKAARIDNIPADILQVDPHLSAKMLYPLFLDIWKEERFPKDWKEGIIVKIPKKGDYRNCNNWRGITLLVVISSLHSYYTGQNIRHNGNRNSEGVKQYYIIIL